MIFHILCVCVKVMTVVPRSVLRAETTPRLHSLARHKTYPPLPIKSQSEWDWGKWESDVSPAARSAEASIRVGELAQAKKDHLLYHPCRCVCVCVCVQ